MKRKKKWAVEGQIKRNEDKKYILNKWQLLYSSLKCLFMRRFSRIFLSSLTRTNWKPVPVTTLPENAFWTKEKIYEHILLKVLWSDTSPYLLWQSLLHFFSHPIWCLQSDRLTVRTFSENHRFFSQLLSSFCGMKPHHFAPFKLNCLLRSFIHLVPFLKVQCHKIFSKTEPTQAPVDQSQNWFQIGCAYFAEI